MDEVRFADLRDKLSALELRSSVMLVALSQSIGPLQTSAEFRATLKDHVCTLVDDAAASMSKTGNDLELLMASVALQVVQDINDGLNGQKLPSLTPELSGLVTSQLKDLVAPTSRIREIIRKINWHTVFLQNCVRFYCLYKYKLLPSFFSIAFQRLSN